MMTAAADVEVPEPSPLFWQHLSARVHEAVAAEESLRATRWSERWLSWRVTLPLSVAAAAAVLIAAAITLRTGTSPGADPRDPAPSTPTLAEATANASELAPLAQDPSLSLMADLAENLDWDGAIAAGLMIRTGTVDRAMNELSVDEQLELQRLLKEELSPSGA